MNKKCLFLIHWLFLLPFLTGCEDQQKALETKPYPQVEENLPQANTQPKSFASCEELTAWATARMARTKVELAKYKEWLDSNRNYGLPVSSSAGVQPTIGIDQESAVEEGDLVKVSQDHIFVVRSDIVEVVTRDHLLPVRTLLFPDLKKLEIFTSNRYLVVIGERTNSDGSVQTVVESFFLTGNQRLQSAFKTEYDGAKVSTRLINEALLLVTSQNLVQSGLDPTLGLRPAGFVSPSTVPTELKVPVAGKLNGVACDKIEGQIFNDLDFRMTTVSSLDFGGNEPKASEPVGLIGGSDIVYVTNQNIFIGKSEGFWYPWDRRWQRLNTLILRQVSFDAKSGTLEVRGAGVVKGSPYSRWALKEFPDVNTLVVGTTIRNSSQQNAENVLWSLDIPRQKQTMEIVNQSQSFGAMEDIRALRFVGEKAYAVTFRKTDPLFTFDLSDPRKIRLLSEVEIPGFSTFLQPTSKNALFGIGYGTKDTGNFDLVSGVQLSLFETCDPNHIEVKEQVELGGRGSYSQATADAHAFLNLPSRKLVGFPITIIKGNSDWGWNGYLDFSGALLYRNDHLLAPVAKLTHWEAIPDRCRTLQSQPQWWQTNHLSLDINRIFELDGKLLTVSSFAIKAHSFKHLQDEPIDSLIFENNQSVCDKLSTPIYPVHD